MSNYKNITQKDIDFFRNILGTEKVSSDVSVKEAHARDETEDLFFLPELVLFPSSSAEISEIMKYCSSERIPVTTRGAGTGLSGGALPVKGGVVLSTRKLNKIEWIDEANMQACVQSGVINYEFQEAVKQKKLFYPPDPASWQSCTLGGNVAHASGGPRAVKYGTTRDYILNLEVVLPDGNIIWTGANTLKYSTGYNLTHLMIGSEGTLGIVTRIVTRLIPWPEHQVLLLVPFKSATEACRMVNAFFMDGCKPSAMEFMEKEAIQLSASYCGHVPVPVQESWEAVLLIETDGFTHEEAMKEMEKIVTVLEKNSHQEMYFAETHEDKESLWRIRRKAGEAVKHTSVYKEEDTVVPRACLPELLKAVKEITSRYGIRAVCYGHAGDGNLHVNILKDGMSDEQWKNELPGIIRSIFIKCKELGGTISGEHGIGWVQKPYLDIVFPPFHIDLFYRIKQSFDPNFILNPCKIF